MPDFCVQVGTSLPRNKANLPARPREQKRKGQDAAALAAAAPSPAAGARLTAAAGAYHAGSQAGDPRSAPEHLQPIAGSREQRKKARAARFPRVVVADTVTDYRRVIPLLVDPSDIVLEVGCCSGSTTNVLFDHCARAVGASCRHCLDVVCSPSAGQRLRKMCLLTVSVVCTSAGVDLSDTELTKARARYPHIEFHRIGMRSRRCMRICRHTVVPPSRAKLLTVVHGCFALCAVQMLLTLQLSKHCAISTASTRFSWTLMAAVMFPPLRNSFRFMLMAGKTQMRRVQLTPLLSRTGAWQTYCVVHR